MMSTSLDCTLNGTNGLLKKRIYCAAQRKFSASKKVPSRKKGYMGRYMRHELHRNKLYLLLGAVFLLGAAAGCQIAGEESSGVLAQLSGYLSTAGEQTRFLQGVLTGFTANAAVLLVLFLCGFGAIFQPVVLLTLFLKGVGFGVMGVFSFSSGEHGAVLYYLLVLLPEALATVFLLSAAAGESLRFSRRFFVQLLPEKATDELPPRQGSIGGYAVKFVLFYLLSGTLSVLVGVLKLLCQSIVS